LYFISRTEPGIVFAELNDGHEAIDPVMVTSLTVEKSALA
jgi:hypothetical protein